MPAEPTTRAEIVAWFESYNKKYPGAAYSLEHYAIGVFGPKSVAFARRYVKQFIASSDSAYHSVFDLAISYPVKKSYTTADYHFFMQQVAALMFKPLFWLNAWVYRKVTARKPGWSRIHAFTYALVCLLEGIVAWHFGRGKDWWQVTKDSLKWYWEDRATDFYTNVHKESKARLN